MTTGVRPPQITVCPYLPLSIPVMWKLALNEETLFRGIDTSTAFGKFYSIHLTIKQLAFHSEFACKVLELPELANKSTNSDESQSNNLDLVRNLCSIKDDLGNRAVTLGLLRNVPNITYDNFLEELSPSADDTIMYCSNGGRKCNSYTKLNKSGHLLTCFTFDTQDMGISNGVVDDGISQGISMVLMSGTHLSSFYADLLDDIPGKYNSFLRG